VDKNDVRLPLVIRMRLRIRFGVRCRAIERGRGDKIYQDGDRNVPPNAFRDRFVNQRGQAWQQEVVGGRVAGHGHVLAIVARTICTFRHGQGSGSRRCIPRFDPAFKADTAESLKKNALPNRTRPENLKVNRGLAFSDSFDFRALRTKMPIPPSTPPETPPPAPPPEQAPGGPPEDPIPSPGIPPDQTPPNAPPGPIVAASQ
jgi:hypothetical protein